MKVGLRKLLTFIAAFIVLPAIFGGLFTLLELESEKALVARNRAFEQRLQWLSETWNQSDPGSSAEFSPSSATFGRESRREVLDSLNGFVEDLDLHSQPGDYDFGFLGSTFFYITIATTIGYGTRTPVTLAGRILVMVVAIVGIPLTFIAMQDMGKRIVRFASRLSLKFLQCSSSEGSLYLTRYEELTARFNRDAAFRYKVEFRVTAFLMALSLFVFPIAIGRVENWTYPESVYFAFVSLFTIGFGDVYPETSSRTFKILGVVWLYFGLCMVIHCLQIAGDATKRFRGQGHKLTDDEYMRESRKAGRDTVDNVQISELMSGFFDDTPDDLQKITPAMIAGKSPKLTPGISFSLHKRTESDVADDSSNLSNLSNLDTQMQLWLSSTSDSEEENGLSPQSSPKRPLEKNPHQVYQTKSSVSQHPPP